mmetsp:Transcript_38882/g.90460  ORF Transcript_38882/g.90460 Transcript_38882/m.90460 type:complete len:146 (+) Transcript_38882:1692-2129(+)
MTAGWELEVEHKDGTTSWLLLKELKETNSVEVAEYAINNRIADQPAFEWWVKQVMKKKKRLIKLSKSHIVRRGYKFGIKIPRTVAEALELDEENRINGDKSKNTWYKAIMKEMENVMVAIEVKEKGSKPPPGYKPVDLMMVFDVK